MLKSANIGSTDRIIRIVIGIALAVYAYSSLLSPWSLVAYAIAAVLVLTAIVRFCPAYRLIGASTCKTAR